MTPWKFSVDLDEVPDKYLFVRAFEYENVEPDRNIYFYHLGKTGGTTVNAYLNALGAALGRAVGNLRNRMGKEMIPPSPERLSPMPWIVTGHAVYPYHEFFGSDFSLVTIIRDPVDRILSEYFWKYRMEDESKLSDRALFLDFLDQHARHNYLAMCLFGGQFKANSSAEEALRILSEMKYVTTTPGISRLLSVIATHNGGPSIWVNNAKVNPSTELKGELHNEYNGAIRDRNEIDQLLFEHADRRRKSIDEQYEAMEKFAHRDPEYAVITIPTEETRIATGKDVLMMDLKSSQAMVNSPTWCQPPNILGSFKPWQPPAEFLYNGGKE